MALHARQLGRQRRGKCGRIIEAREFRHTLQILVCRWQRLRLLVGDHLQAMLDRAQDAVGVRQVALHLGLDPAALGELHERRERLRHAQVGLAASGDQLLRLGEELDLADAAAPELDVVARDRDLAEALEGVDLPLHGVNVGDGGEVEVLAPDEGGQLVEEGMTGGEIAGNRAAP